MLLFKVMSLLVRLDIRLRLVAHFSSIANLVQAFEIVVVHDLIGVFLRVLDWVEVRSLRSLLTSRPVVHCAALFTHGPQMLILLRLLLVVRLFSHGVVLLPVIVLQRLVPILPLSMATFLRILQPLEVLCIRLRQARSRGRDHRPLLVVLLLLLTCQEVLLLLPLSIFPLVLQVDRPHFRRVKAVADGSFWSSIASQANCALRRQFGIIVSCGRALSIDGTAFLWLFIFAIIYFTVIRVVKLSVEIGSNCGVRL